MLNIVIENIMTIKEKYLNGVTFPAYIYVVQIH
jgi:hypothetical protein